MEKDLERIVKRITEEVADDSPIQIQNILENSFGLVIVYYSIENGRNYTLTLSSIIDLIVLGKKQMERDSEC